MRKIIFLFLLFASDQILAQTPNNLFGIVRKNFYTLIKDPSDTNFSYERFDSATVRLGTTDPSFCMVYNLGSYTYQMAINLTGAALNPYINSYIFVGGSNIVTAQLTDGKITNNVPLINPIAESYFDNFRFNNADSSLYGLARRNIFDPVTGLYNGQMYLAKISTQSGIITQISPNSIGNGFALAGSAIDPYQMVYYYSTGSNLVGLDIYNGSVFSNVPIGVNEGTYFDNFTYSCADTALYGLVRQNHYSYKKDPTFPKDSFQYLDSSTIKLGRINPNTGVVTVISPYSIMQGGYTLNGGSAIDPNFMTYYYNRGNGLVGVSLVSGLVVSNLDLSFENGQYFDLMRNFENCIYASPFRRRGGPSALDKNIETKNVEIYPNPSQDKISIESNFPIKQISIRSMDGRQLYQQNVGSSQMEIDIHALPNGLYVLHILDESGRSICKKLLKN